MIIGVGIDIVNNQRIKELYQTYKDDFLKKILSTSELQLYAPDTSIEHLSGIFAVKEATIKACSNIDKRLKFHDIVVMNNENGAPYIEIDSHKLTQKFTNLTYHVSISHEQQYSVAIVICERN